MQNGHHILLDEDQYALLQSTFNFSGIPRYLIINKNGQIVDENAERPGSPNIRTTLIYLINE
ncbi:MAG: hypothetical protein WD555_02835 [Fulvivirga sp.]